LVQSIFVFKLMPWVKQPKKPGVAPNAYCALTSALSSKHSFATALNATHPDQKGPEKRGPMLHWSAFCSALANEQKTEQ
jgi:hypothetical protein